MPRKRKEEMTNTPENVPMTEHNGFPQVLGKPVEPEEKSPAIATPYYQTAGELETAFLQRVIKTFHKELVDAKVVVSMQFVESPDGAPSVKVRGFECFGKVVTPSADYRAAGSPDMRLVIDRAKWDNATVDEQEAALDSLLEQREVCTTEKGEILRDKAGHPKLKKRKPDVFVEGYARVAEEHGNAAIECKQFAAVSGVFAQMKLFEEVGQMQSVG